MVDIRFVEQNLLPIAPLIHLPVDINVASRVLWRHETEVIPVGASVRGAVPKLSLDLQNILDAMALRHSKACGRAICSCDTHISQFKLCQAASIQGCEAGEAPASRSSNRCRRSCCLGISPRVAYA
jgi:hypothetical protein